MTDTTDTWQKRLLLEHDELCERISKLRVFMSTPRFSALPPIDQNDLHEQLTHQTRLAVVLGRSAERHSLIPGAADLYRC